MLISSVNFINRGRTEKYHRREKGDILKDETPQELTYCKKHADKVSKLKKGYQLKGHSETVSQVSEEISSPRTSGYGSSASVTSSDLAPSSPTSAPDRVSISTADEYNVYIDPSFYFVTLKKQKQITKCSSFTRHLINTETLENGGRIHNIQLCLSCDPDYFLTTNAQRQLELKLFQDDEHAVSEGDERLFTVHESTTGQSFIQPTNHKGYYFHHLDGKLSISKLELHLRPPEEYMFHVHSHGNTCMESSQALSKLTVDSEKRGSQAKHTFLCQQDLTNTKIQSSQCAWRDITHCHCTTECDCSLYSQVDFDKQNRTKCKHESHDSEVLARNTDSEKINYREKCKGKKTVSAKRSSIYNVVSMTGSCFGFGHKPRD